jgi:hypothetical protein
VFEEHITEMISLLPKDGQTVDILEWFYRFTLDSSTHYLFGQSVGSLSDSKVLLFYPWGNSRVCLQSRLRRFSILWL